MGKIKSLQLISSGFVLGAMFFGGISYAAGSIKIDAFYGIKLIQNGIDKTPKENKPFTVNGTTYVPLRAISDILKVPIKWEGKTSSVILGEKIAGIPLGSPNLVDSHLSTNTASMATNKPMVINKQSFGTEGYKLDSNFYYDNEYVNLKYILNGQYSNLLLGLGIDDEDSNEDVLRNITFSDQDGNVLKQVSLGSGVIEEGIKIDVKGVLEIHVSIKGNSYGVIDFINPVLTK